MNRGILVIGFILLMGIVGGTGAVWFHYARQHRSLEFWGIEVAARIRHAEKVEVTRLEKVDDSDPRTDVISLDGERFCVVERIDVTEMPGLLHARHALIEDASFDWDHSDPDCEPNWEYGITFRREGFLVIRRIRRE